MAEKRKKANVEVVESLEGELFKNVRSILAKARATVYTAANAAMVEAYWKVGREIVEKQGGTHFHVVLRSKSHSPYSVFPHVVLVVR